MTRKEKRVLYRIIVAAVLLIAAWIAPIDGILSLFAFLIPYFVIGYDVLWKSVRNILNGQIFDENFLMALATIGALVTGEYHEAVAVMLFYQIGELFQDIAVGKSRKSITELMNIRPDHAVVLRDGAEVTLSPEEVEIGEIIIVRPGEKVPLDGVIIKGHTTADTSALTGESVPRTILEGENITSGFVNLTSVIEVRVTNSFEESTVSKILELVENSAAKKAKTEKFITRFARYYTPCVVIGAVLLAVIPPIFLGGWENWLKRALIFLVVSCPCALVISVPMSFFGGIGGASKKGILIKGANYLEALSKISTVVFDKTGTLTHGSFEVTEIKSPVLDENELLKIASLCESFSNHPIAESIVKAYGKEPEKELVNEVTEHPGLGIEAIIEGKRYFAGNLKLMEKAGAQVSEEECAGTAVYISEESRYLGRIVISDKIKEDAKLAVNELLSLKTERIVMLTGDSKTVGESVGKALGISEVHSELLPQDKVTIVEKLLGEKKPKTHLAFSGDGINDAPVLSRADVGIAMGAMGSDAAIEDADVVLMDDKPSKVAEAVRISRRTMKIVYQNIVFALGVKGIVLILAALGFANMWIAVFADVGVAMIAILNSMRALK